MLHFDLPLRTDVDGYVYYMEFHRRISITDA
jgi:hypothetical protein